MLAIAHTFALDGGETRHLTVEAEVRTGLPAFRLIGAPGSTARERLPSAIRNSGMSWPGRRVTVAVRPAAPRAGAGALDLAIACAVLCASGQLPRERLGRYALLGELGLDGAVGPVGGTFALATAVRERGMRGLALASAAAREASLAGVARVAPVRDLRAAAALLGGERPEPLPPRPSPAEPPGGRAERTPDLSDLRGQPAAARALIVAAAGGHSLLLVGAPGVGKTMLAARLPGILPPPDREEALELARIRSLLGEEVPRPAARRPFRAPHHSLTPAGLLGRARDGWTGECVLAHRGALFLDELTQFARPTLDALRQPLDDGSIMVLRARRRIVRPARFVFVCATNPCPCGGDGAERCSCRPGELRRHERRIPAALLDRIELRVPMAAATRPGRGEAAPASALAREAVRAARERSRTRLVRSGLRLNAELDAASLAGAGRGGSRAQAMLERERRTGTLGPRGEHAVLRVARTLADLDGRPRVRDGDVAEALALRLGRAA